MRVSAIVSAYNRPGHVRRCLLALEEQTRPPDEVIVSDDGSAPAHAEALREIVGRCALPALYVRQEDLGFRAAACRNNGARMASGDLLLFVDGDVVLLPDAVEQHVGISGGRRWTAGNALLLDRRESELVTDDAIRARKLGELWPAAEDPRVAKLERMDRKLRARTADPWLRISEARMRQIRLITLQCAVPRWAFERVNGFDENYVGWGREDHDLSLRLQLAGVRGRSAIFAARAFHLYHEPLWKDAGEGGPPRSVNDAYYARRRWRRYRARRGLAHR